MISAAARKAAATADVTVVALGLTCKTVDADSNGRCGGSFGAECKFQDGVGLELPGTEARRPAPLSSAHTLW
jgi:hypothetical protein